MSVLEFKLRAVKGEKPKLSDKPRYFCKQCDGEIFHILEDKTVACATPTCLRMICNLRVE